DAAALRPRVCGAEYAPAVAIRQPGTGTGSRFESAAARARRLSARGRAAASRRAFQRADGERNRPGHRGGARRRPSGDRSGAGEKIGAEAGRLGAPDQATDEAEFHHGDGATDGTGDRSLWRTPRSARGEGSVHRVFREAQTRFFEVRLNRTE